MRHAEEVDALDLATVPAMRHSTLRVLDWLLNAALTPRIFAENAGVPVQEANVTREVR